MVCESGRVLATRVDARREISFRRVACAVFVAGSVYWLWRWSSPWNRPFWPVLGIVAAWLVLLAGVEADSLSRRARAISAVTMALVTVAFLWAMVYAPLGPARYGSSFDALERTAHQLLGVELDGYKPCGPGIDGLDYGGLGVPDEICVSVYDNPMSGSVQQVRFRWGSRTLVYEGGARPMSSSQCFDHLEGPWWAEVPADPSCPYGFSFSGMG